MFSDNSYKANTTSSDLYPSNATLPAPPFPLNVTSSMPLPSNGTSSAPPFPLNVTFSMPLPSNGTSSAPLPPNATSSMPYTPNSTSSTPYTPTFYQGQQGTSTEGQDDLSIEKSNKITWPSRNSLRPLAQPGQCEKCKSPMTGYSWCQYCNSEHFQMNFSHWSSGNKELDNFIQMAQRRATNARSILEWIEYDKFKNVTHLADGGNSSVFTANWPQGPIRAWDVTAKTWERGWPQMESDVIILKRIKNSNKVTSDFLGELSAYHQFSTLVSHVVRCYGISLCPSTREFIVVTSYARDGDLRKYLDKNFSTLTWLQRINTLKDIAGGLVSIHRAGLVHKDLHTGNILLDNGWTMISDLGLCWSNSAFGEDGKIRGVLPYVAPEVLRGRPYTRASDVYSVGIIMYELWSGRRPFRGRRYDGTLALEICSGARPEISSDIPDYYSLIMQACWNGDPDMRPTSRDLEITFNGWIEKIAKRQLVPPKMVSHKGDTHLKAEDINSTPSSHENTTSQPLPSLSDVQLQYVDKIEECRETLYQNCLNQRLHEFNEQECDIEESLNPMTWTSELRVLADQIFETSGMVT
ncbi:18457_t:CDS:2 [Acaulospora morrowiae]|uniref:18457_t:CDS:1 n=1 Tax=Acaulospora morrowiae TaxID=94023 RepID=A0A9N8WQM9_9GLOM|nr:18457_t:CDS:2 [Acaulospora morrowiae]